MGGSGELQSPPSARTELIDFTIERERHRRFVGREDVLARLDEWLLGPDDTGWVVVTGGPGMGKSAILSAWLGRREAAGAVMPHHFVRRQVIDWDQPERIAASLAAQIEAMFPGLRDPAARPEGRLLELLVRVSKHLGASGRLVIVVDGLDETRAEPGENPLPRFLPHVVPAGIRILCATRPTYPHLGWIEARSPARCVSLDDGQWASSNEAVVRGFWEAVGPDYQPPLPAAMVTAAIARAEGNVLHAVMLHDALRNLPPAQHQVDRIPRGLKELIGEVWDRAASRESVRVGLGLLCAAQEALSLDALAEIAGWGYDDRARFVREARQLLLEEPASWSGVEAYRPRHDWVRELMIERLGTATVRAHHEMLARKLASWPAPAEPAARRYALRHALHHRAEVGDWADTWRLAADMSFLEAKCRELGAHETEVDVARAAERCRASGNESLRRRFDDLARALGRESHWLGTAPEATVALLWNRLWQWGWSTDEIEQQLHLPVGSSFLRVRHLTTRESSALVRDLVGHTDRVTACAVTPDGRRVVSASDDKTLKVWDLETGRAVATLEGCASSVTACAVTPDGRRMVSVSEGHTFKMWDLETERAVAMLEGPATLVHAYAVTSDGRRVVSASDDKTLKVWDLETGRAVATLEGCASSVTACAVTPDGRRMVLAAHFAPLQVWDLETERAVATLGGGGSWVRACAVTPDGTRVVSAWENQTLQVLDLETGRVLATLDGHAGRVTACAVTPDSRWVISASEDQTLKMWDLETGRAVATLAGHADWVRACAVTPDGRRMVSASNDKTLKLWDLGTGRGAATLDGHTARVNACAVTSDGRRVVSASNDKTLKVWDPETGCVVATLEGHTDWVRACTVTPDSRRVVSASDDHTLQVWDLETGRVVARLAGHAAWVTACAVTPDGRLVVSASTDQMLKVWDLETGHVATLEGHADWVNACVVTPDGRHVVSVSNDETLKVWDLNTGRTMSTLEGHAASVTACAVTPDGRQVVSASEDKTLKVWNLNTGRPVTTLEGHVASVTACAVTPNGRQVVSASEDKTLRVWDLKTGACLFTHRANAAYHAVTTTTTTIIAGDAVGAIWFLDWPSPNRRESANRDARGPDNKPTPSSEPELPVQRPTMKHTILFLAANPLGTDRLALDREARAIQVELERSGFRDRFELVTRWAAEPLDLLRELRKLKPTVVHFSGHGAAAAGQHPDPAPRRDVVGESGHHGGEPRHGLFFQGPDGGPQLVSTQALEETFGAAGASVQLVILSACYSEVQAKALLPHVGCVVGMNGAIHDAATRSFAIGFYGGLGERESVAVAYKQGCAAIRLDGLGERDRPQLLVRAGVDVSKLILAADSADPPASGSGASTAAGSQPRLPGARPAAPPRVDIGILTIRDDEQRAVINVFPDKAGTIQGAHREYTLRHADAGRGERYTVAVVRQVEQGLGEAQTVARDLIDDLAPRLILVVGIAGGLPSDDVTLGDVVLSTRIHDFTIEARKTGHEATYAATGGPIDKALANAVADLANREDELGDWTSDLPARPPVTWTRKGQLYGPPEWQSELRAKLEHHYPKGAPPRAPVYMAGPIASSDRLVKDPTVLIPWLQTARNLLAIEMESGGVYRAVRERCPMIAIRGLSDIVGLKRADAWTKYACASAAAFTRAFLRTRPVPVDASASDPW